jgi:integrase
LQKRGIENVGTRVLTDAELQLFWRDIVTPTAARRIGLGLRLALMTGARVGEIAGMSREEVSDIDDPARASWTIPAERVKNKRDHVVPLSPLARDTVLELLAMTPPGENHLFPTRAVKRRGGAIRSNSLTQAMSYFAERLEGDDAASVSWRAELPTPHDLRRTLTTRLAAMGIPREVREAVLNHKSDSTESKHYNKYEFEPEKRAALTRWSLAVSATVAPAPATKKPRSSFAWRR